MAKSNTRLRSAGKALLAASAASLRQNPLLSRWKVETSQLFSRSNTPTTALRGAL